jgi:hypothetical protein
VAHLAQLFDFSGWRDHPRGRFSCCSRTVRDADCS